MAEHAVDHVADVNEQLGAEEIFPIVHSVLGLAIMLSVVGANMTTYSRRISATSSQKSVAPPKANNASVKP